MAAARAKTMNAMQRAARAVESASILQLQIARAQQEFLVKEHNQLKEFFRQFSGIFIEQGARYANEAALPHV
jgi:hypothetical protein